jgi:hypothetical protein
MAGACERLGADDITRLQRFSDLPGQLGLVGGPGPDAGDAGRVPPMLGNPLDDPVFCTLIDIDPFEEASLPPGPRGLPGDLCQTKRWN